MPAYCLAAFVLSTVLTKPLFLDRNDGARMRSVVAPRSSVRERHLLKKSLGIGIQKLLRQLRLPDATAMCSSPQLHIAPEVLRKGVRSTVHVKEGQTESIGCDLFSTDIVELNRELGLYVLHLGGLNWASGSLCLRPPARRQKHSQHYCAYDPNFSALSHRLFA